MSDIPAPRTYVIEAARPANVLGQFGGVAGFAIIAIVVAVFLSGDSSAWVKAASVVVGIAAGLGALFLAGNSFKVDETSLRFDGDAVMVQQAGQSTLFRWPDIAFASVARRGPGNRVLWRDLVLHLRSGEAHTIRGINRLGFADGGTSRRVDVVGGQETALLDEIRAHVDVRS